MKVFTDNIMQQTFGALIKKVSLGFMMIPYQELPPSQLAGSCSARSESKPNAPLPRQKNTRAVGA
jgi:hypothetical protein